MPCRLARIPNAGWDQEPDKALMTMAAQQWPMQGLVARVQISVGAAQAPIARQGNVAVEFHALGEDLGNVLVKKEQAIELRTEAWVDSLPIDDGG